jgi:hypothetical protein
VSKLRILALATLKMTYSKFEYFFIEYKKV